MGTDKPVVRIDLDDRDNLDDIAISDVTMFRMEWMSNHTVWVCAYTKDNPDGYRFWLNSKKKIKGHQE